MPLIVRQTTPSLQSFPTEFLVSALPAARLRLDRRLLLIKGLRFAPINANPAPLTARAASRLGPLGRAFAFYAPLRVAARAKTREQRTGPCRQKKQNCISVQGSSDKVYHLQLEKLQDQ